MARTLSDILKSKCSRIFRMDECSEGSRGIYSHCRDGEHQSPDPYLALFYLMLANEIYKRLLFLLVKK